MSSYDKCIPTDQERWIGTVYDVHASRVIATMPQAAAPVRHHHGTGVQAGEVGEHVFIPADRGYVFGRISRVWLETGERLYADGRTAPREVHPMAEIQLLSDVDQATLAPSGAVARPPRVGAAVYSAHPDALAQVLNMAGRGTGKVARDGERLPGVRLGKVPGMHDSEELQVAPEALFARHCAVLGQTGGGKSWTLARLIESCQMLGARILLIDPTGEYGSLGSTPMIASGASLALGSTSSPSEVLCQCPYHVVREDDLFALLRPSQQIQAPILREAIRSLRLVYAAEHRGNISTLGRFHDNGCVSKSGKPCSQYHSLLAEFPEASQIDAEFDPSKLSRQIQLECVKKTGATFGGIDDFTAGVCAHLCLRIDDLFQSHAGRLFGVAHADLFAEMTRALSGDKRAVVRVSLAGATSERDVRPVIVNIIGRWLSHQAQQNTTVVGRDKPLLVFLDEAHQFLGKSIGDDTFKQRLEAFETIAREGRKYGLLLCMATQRPRDLQQAVLSQVGAMIVHRMGHPEDRQVVTQAMRDAERGAGAFLSTLAQGHAIVVGAGLPVPIPVEIDKPKAEPDSLDPDLSGIWARNQIAKE